MMPSTDSRLPPFGVSLMLVSTMSFTANVLSSGRSAMQSVNVWLVNACASWRHGCGPRLLQARVPVSPALHPPEADRLKRRGWRQRLPFLSHGRPSARAGRRSSTTHVISGALWPWVLVSGSGPTLRVGSLGALGGSRCYSFGTRPRQRLRPRRHHSRWLRRPSSSRSGNFTPPIDHLCGPVHLRCSSAVCLRPCISSRMALTDRDDPRGDLRRHRANHHDARYLPVAEGRCCNALPLGMATTVVFFGDIRPARTRGAASFSGYGHHRRAVGRTGASAVHASSRTSSRAHHPPRTSHPSDAGAVQFTHILDFAIMMPLGAQLMDGLSTVLLAAELRAAPYVSAPAPRELPQSCAPTRWCELRIRPIACTLPPCPSPPPTRPDQAPPTPPPRRCSPGGVGRRARAGRKMARRDEKRAPMRAKKTHPGRPAADEFLQVESWPCFFSPFSPTTRHPGPPFPSCAQIVQCRTSALPDDSRTRQTSRSTVPQRRSPVRREEIRQDPRCAARRPRAGKFDCRH